MSYRILKITVIIPLPVGEVTKVIYPDDQADDIAAAALKEREEFLKMIPLEGFTQVDPLTGEVVDTMRPEKRSEEGYSITIDK